MPTWTQSQRGLKIGWRICWCGALAAAVAWGMRTMRTLRARVAALEAAKDATWADEVRKAIAASK